MGYYTDISNNKDYAAEGTAQLNRMRGASGHTIAGVLLSQTVPSIFMTIASKVADGKGSDKSNETKGSSESSGITELQNKLQSLLNEIGAESENDINEAVSRAQNKRDEKVGEAQDKVNTFIDGTDKYSVKIAELSSQIVEPQNGVELTAEQKAQNDKINEKIENLKAKKEEAYNKAVADLEEVTKNEDAKVQEKYDKAQEAIEVLEQLKELNKVGEEEIKVEEKTEALADFTKYRKLFSDTNAPAEKRIEYGNKLTEIAKANPNDKTIQDAYKMLESQIKALALGKTSQNTQINKRSFGI